MDVFLGLFRFVFLIVIVSFFTYVLLVLNKNLSLEKSSINLKTFFIVRAGENFLGVEKGHKYLIKDECYIGRNKENSIVIKDPYSSNYHAHIKKKNNKYFVSDMDSKNGTLLNEINITKDAPLKSGDKIQIGEVILQFQIS